MGHSVFLLWGYESKGFISRWFIMGGSYIFRFSRFSRRRCLLFLVVRNLSSCWHQTLQRNSIHRSYHHVRFSLLFFIPVKPVGSSVLALVSYYFRFLLFLQGFHIWTLNPFHMMGVRVFRRSTLVSNPWGNPG